MYRQLIQPVLFLFGLTLVLSACAPEPDFSDTPQIEFLGIDQTDRLPPQAGVVGASARDSIVITLGFTDGDGDLGITPPAPRGNKADSLAFYSTYKDWGNYQIKTLRLVGNNRYEEIRLTENNVVFFPPLSREGSRGAIEGTLDLRQIFNYSRSSKITPIKFQIKIRDRALHESNVIETDTVHVPILVQ